MATKRERIEPNEGDSRYVRRDERGKFTADQSDVGRAFAQDRRTNTKHVAPKGQGDRVDRPSS
jgi:hypothetical protein